MDPIRINSSPSPATAGPSSTLKFNAQQIGMIAGAALMAIAMGGVLIWGLSGGDEVKQRVDDEQAVAASVETPVEEPPVESNPEAAYVEPSESTEAAEQNPADGDRVRPMPKSPVTIVVPEVKPANTEKPKPVEPKETKPPKTSSAKPIEPAKPATPSTPPKDPFYGFSARISLPAVVADKRNKLGPVKIPDDYLCTLYLVGGESASRDRAVISLEPLAGSERDWEIFAKAYTGGDKPEKIAHLQIKDQSLWLTWTEDAVENAASPALANCMLKISAGQGAHQVLLRQSITVDALPVTYEKTDRDWELANLPLNTKTQVELSVKVPKDFPRPRFLGSAAIPAANGETFIEFGLKPGERFLKLQIQSKLTKDGINLSVTPFVQVTGQDNPVAYTAANVEKLEGQLAAAIANVDGQVKAMGSNKSAAKTALSKQLSSLKQAQTELGKLKSFKKDFEAQCRIHAKVMYVPSDMIAELMRTK